jgi:hypothetical protein
VATELGLPYEELLKAKQVYADLYPRHLQQGFSHKRQRGGRPNYHSALLMLPPVDGVRAMPAHPRTKPESAAWCGLAWGDRKWSLNDGQRPHFRGVRVALGTGYTRV